MPNPINTHGEKNPLFNSVKKNAVKRLRYGFEGRDLACGEKDDGEDEKKVRCDAQSVREEEEEQEEEGKRKRRGGEAIRPCL